MQAPLPRSLKHLTARWPLMQHFTNRSSGLGRASMRSISASGRLMTRDIRQCVKCGEPRSNSGRGMMIGRMACPPNFERVLLWRLSNSVKVGQTSEPSA
jgi:hypothetical protein